jgi:hypothetical protein
LKAAAGRIHSVGIGDLLRVSVIPNPIDRNLRPPKAGERPKGRRAKWRAAKPADAGAGD